MRPARPLGAIIGLTLVAAPACAHFRAPASAPPGAFIDRSGRTLGDGEVRARLKTATFVLVGESHDNPCDHRQEARVIELAAADRRVAVGLEMVTIDHQRALDRFSSGALPEPELPEALDWKHDWGFDFAAYAPVFSAARPAGPIVGLNTAPELVHEVAAGGLDALPPASRLEVTPEIVPAPPEEEAMLRGAFAEHLTSGHLKGSPDAAWTRFARAQSFWDSQMAWQAARATAVLRLPVVILAGTGHVERGWGIAHRLRRFARGADILSILPWRGGEPPAGADLYFFCPEAR